MCYFGYFRSILFSLYTVESLVVCIYVNDTGMRIYNLSNNGPVLGTGSQSVFSSTRSGAGYQILLSIIFSDLLLGSRSCVYTFYWILYWVPDLIPDPVLGTGSYVFCLILDLVLGTGSRSLFIYTGSGTGYQILLIILFTGSVVST